jgi:hypothetical protein
VPLVPQLDRPAAKAQVDTSSRQSCQECCVFTRIRLRRKTANPVRPLGHQKTSANNVGLSGLCGARLPACCTVVLIVSPTVGNTDGSGNLVVYGLLQQLTVTVANATMTVGGALPALTGTVTGLVNGDTPITMLTV